MQYYLFCENRLLLAEDNSIPNDVEVEAERYRFSIADGVECVAALLDNVPKGLSPVDLRSSYDLLPYEDYQRAGKASELLNWHANHQYCGKCGAKMQVESAICRRCPDCGSEIWPQLSPAVIVLIHRGDEILLVKSYNFRGKYYGLVAGFVELGESLEESLVREIKEETQLEVDDIKYFGSQPWPYPQGLMIGFTARYAGGELKLQDEELSTGGWFDIKNLPDIPKPLSLARKLIDNYLETYNK